MNKPYEHHQATQGVSGKTIVAMRWPFKKNKKTDLEKALIECKKANTQGYKDAEVYIEGVRSSVKKAAQIIEGCVDSMKKHQINDTSIIESVKKQLEVVHTEFEQSFFHTQSDLLKKSNMSSNFNITLFGRTKSGKSTLMEILTHGDGSHMGEGGQRTTRDVRGYDWKGMRVIDVPGIDAYGGQEDDEHAEEAATFADLILFMITERLICIIFGYYLCYFKWSRKFPRVLGLVCFLSSRNRNCIFFRLQRYNNIIISVSFTRNTFFVVCNIFVYFSKNEVFGSF